MTQDDGGVHKVIVGDAYAAAAAKKVYENINAVEDLLYKTRQQFIVGGVVDRFLNHESFFQLGKAVRAVSVQLYDRNSQLNEVVRNIHSWTQMVEKILLIQIHLCIVQSRQFHLYRAQ